MATLFDLQARIGLDSSAYERGLDDASRTTNSFGSRLKNGLGKAAKVGAAALTAAAAGIGALTKSSIDGYANYEQLVGGVETLFKDNADTVIKYAEKAYRESGLSQNQYMETVTSFSASLIQSLGSDTAAAAEYAQMAIVDMSDNANKMGTSMESIQNAYQGFAKQNYTMLDNLKLGYGGTGEEMERLIDDASKLDKSVKKGDKSFANIVRAIHAVQKNLDITGTTAKEASETISGSAAAMSSAWSNLLVGLADPEQDFNQLLTEFVVSMQTFAGNVLKILPNIATGIERLIKGLTPYIGELVESILPTILTAATALVTGLISALPGILQSLTRIGPQVVGDIATAIVNELPLLINTAINMLMTFASTIVENIPNMLIAGAQMVQQIVNDISAYLPGLLFQGTQVLSKFIQGIIEALPTLLDTAWQIINTIITDLGLYIPVMLQQGANLLVMLIQGIAENLPSLATSATDILTNLVNFIVENLPTILAIGSDLISQVITTIAESLPSLATSATDILNNIANFLIENLPSLLTMGVDIINQIISSITESLPTLASIASDILTNLVNFLVENLPGILTMGSNLISQIVTTISESIPNLATSAVDILNQIVSSIIENLPKMLDLGLDLINQLMTSISENLPTLIQSGIDLLQQILSGFVDEVPKLVAEIPGMITKIVTSIGENLPSIITAGGDILTSILEGFTRLFTDIPAVISDLWDSFKTAVDDIDWASIGTNLIDGVKKGIEDAWENAKKAVTDAFEGLVGSIKDLLGIHSPSTVFSDIGENMVAGVESGWNGDITDARGNIVEDLDFNESVNAYVQTFKEAASLMSKYATLAEKSIKQTFEQLATGLGNTIDKIRESINSRWNEISSRTNSTWRNISSSVSSAMGDMQNSISDRLWDISDDISSTFRNAVDTVRDAVRSMRNAMDFEWSLPDIKLPHFKINGKFSLDPLEVPTISVKWYQKAMDNAMLLKGATIFGAMGDKLLGGGEAGQEVVSGADTLMSMIKDAVRDTGTGIGQVIINIDGAQYEDADELANVIAEKLQGIVGRRAAAWA